MGGWEGGREGKWEGKKEGTDLALDWCGLGELRLAYEGEKALLKTKVSKRHTWLGRGEPRHLHLCECVLQREGERMTHCH